MDLFDRGRSALEVLRDYLAKSMGISTIIARHLAQVSWHWRRQECFPIRDAGRSIRRPDAALHFNRAFTWFSLFHT
jgi:hypothetical protein